MADRPSLPPLDVATRVLLLCARLTLTAAQADALQRLCREVSDWPALVRQAEFRLVVPLVRQHLAHGGPDGGPVPGVPGAALAALQARARPLALRTLQLLAVQRRLVERVFGPHGIPHVFVKGPSLALRYYPSAALRTARDIDVLVPREAMVRLAAAFTAAGFAPPLGSAWATPQGAAFQQRFTGMMNWCSADGVLVECKAEFDPEWGRFPTADLLAGREVRDGPAGALAVLPTSTLMCYLAYHHTWHLWARLHWLADLDAVTRHPGFDREVVLAEADARSVRRMVEAAFAVQAAAAEPEPADAARHLHDPYARAVYVAFLGTLGGDYAAELAARRRFRTREADLPAGRLALHRVMRRPLARFRPAPDDFEQLPLPAGWQWLYWALRPPLWAWRRAWA